MATELQNSALLEELRRIAAAPGSPYFQIQAVLHAAGKDVLPIKTVRWDIDRDYTTAWFDASSVVVYLGQGTLLNDITPFQDDLKITLYAVPMTEFGEAYKDVKIQTRTYKAYIGDDVESTVEAGNDITLQSKETGDRTSIRAVTFVLEEMAVNQLRKQSTGVIGEATPPYMVLETLLNRYAQALKLDKDEVISRVDFAPANNQNPRPFVIVPDGTMLPDLPDHIQNTQGGVYSTGLGFYIQDRIMYLWPVYDTTRFNKAARVLQVIMSPNKNTQLIDHTWRDTERTLTIYAAGIAKMVDDTIDQLNNEGNGVRFQMASQALDAPVVVGDNKMTASRTKNNSEFATTVVGDGSNLLRLAGTRVTDNVYLEASRMAKRGCATLMVTWLRSDPSKIIPGMPVEIIYDYNDEIQTLPGVVRGAPSSYEVEGIGPVGDRFRAKTVVVIAVDRNSPEFIKYLKAGGSISAQPEIDVIQVD